MFKVKYDMTEGKLRRVNTRTAALLRSHSSSPYAQRRYGTTATNLSSPLMAGGGMNQRYSPVFERAEDPTLAEDFMPADPQTQNKIFRNLIMFDAIAGPATEYWRDLAFSSNVVLGTVNDDKIDRFYRDAIDASGILSIMPMLLSDYLTFGKFVFHMLFDDRLGYWTDVIPHDLDYISIKVPPVPRLDPLIDVQPSQEMREWATSSDPRAAMQRQQIDPVLVSLMAAGSPIPLAPENTMFLPRRVFSTDHYGTSYLTRIMPFKIYEKALLDASIAGARRRAGPLWHITVWPDAEDSEMSEVLDLFFAAEEDPIGGKVVTREGVTVNPVGGGSADFWKLSDEWTFLSEAKMRALGISDTFMSGEANWNSMEMILSTFLEKVRAVRTYFTRKILLEKMFLQLAEIHGFKKRTEAELSHRVRTGGPRGSSEPEYLIPTVEWDKPLSPVADREYMDIIDGLEEKGLPVPIRMKAQAAGFDLDKAIASFPSDLTTQKQLYEHKRAKAKLAQSYGFDPQGDFVGEGAAPGGDLGEGFGDFEGIGDEGGAGALEGLGLGDESPIGGGEETPEPAAPEPPAADEAGPGGAGASGDNARFVAPTAPSRFVKATNSTATNIVRDLERLPLWDGDGSLFGLSRRQVAKILDRIDHTDPTPRIRLRLASKLLGQLRRKEGLDRAQANIVHYIAMRMGYIPAVPLSNEGFDFLRKYILGRMNGDGLTKAVTNEIVMLSQVAKAGGRKVNANLAEVVDPSTILPRIERGLDDSQTLTGVTDSPFTKG